MKKYVCLCMCVCMPACIYIPVLYASVCVCVCVCACVRACVWPIYMHKIYIMSLATHTWQWGQYVWEEESTSQHSGWGRTTAGLSLKRRLMSSAVSKERRQNSHAAYLYSSFHENCAHTSGVSVRITSRSLKFVLAYNPLPWKKKKERK